MTLASLEDMISQGDEMNALVRAILQSIKDQGGDKSHLKRLVTDAKSGRSLLTDLARKTIGGIWELASQNIDLGSIDFACTAEEFGCSFPDLPRAESGYSRAADEDKRTPYAWDFSETVPRGPCTYTLWHSSQSLWCEELPKLVLGENREHAGWRELLVYVSRLTVNDLSRCSIVAAGSHKARLSSIDFAYPVACEAKGTAPQGIVRVYHNGGRSEKFGPDYFYLVRVY
ncbi:MAG: hypothetical protein JWN90_14 [Parcubacteria group bacterium]|nr:hypothetical protein [Parcubacteria group bacterium]